MPSINNNAKQFDVLKQKYEVFRNKVPDMIAIQAVNFFKRNFELQGFVDNGIKKWKSVSNPADRSRQILRKRGTLKNAIKKIKAERNKVVVGVGADVKYASITNDGGKIKITPKMRRYFWAMYMEEIGGTTFKRDKNEKVVMRETQENEKRTAQAEFWKALALTKNDHITIPQRQFIGDSAALVKNIDRMIVKEMNLALKS